MMSGKRKIIYEGPIGALLGNDADYEAACQLGEKYEIPADRADEFVKDIMALLVATRETAA